MTSGTTTGPGNPTLMRGIGQGFNGDNQNTASPYDGAGNAASIGMPNRGAAAAVYDPEDRLTELSSGGSPFFQASYTGDGLRAMTDSSGQRTYYLYDDDVPVVEMRGSQGQASVSAVNIFGAEWPAGAELQSDNHSFVHFRHVGERLQPQARV